MRTAANIFIMSLVLIGCAAGPERSIQETDVRAAGDRSREALAAPRPANREQFIFNLRRNVLAITASFPNGATQAGFGFVTGMRGRDVYIATANHTVRDGLENAGTIKVTPYLQQGRSFDASLLGTHDSRIDLAVLTVRLPDDVDLLWDVVSDRPAERGQEVWFIGRSGQWFIPHGAGFVNDVIDANHEIVVEDLPVRVGTSGAPLVADSGIIGMIVSDEAELAVATTIDIMRRQFERWQHPWQLDSMRADRLEPPREPPREPPQEPPRELVIPPFDDRPTVRAKMNTSVAYPTERRIKGEIDYDRIHFRKWRDVQDSTLTLNYQGVQNPVLTRRASDAFDATSDLAVFDIDDGIALVQRSILGAKWKWRYEGPEQSRRHYEFFNDERSSVVLEDYTFTGLRRVDYDVLELLDRGESCLSFASATGRRRIEGFFCKFGEFTDTEAVEFLTSLPT